MIDKPASGHKSPSDLPLLGLTGGELSLYYHVPFCSSRCDYCAFYSQTFSQDAVNNWLSASLSDTDEFLARLRPDSIQTIYFGGGTPSLIPAGFLVSLIRNTLNHPSLMSQATAPEEISIEANPGSISHEWISTLAEGGATRITMGMQSFDRTHRQTLGRSGDSLPHPGLLQSYANRILDHGLHLGIDLITGIPGQSPESAASDVRRAVELGADHLSIYRLGIEEGTPLFKRLGGKGVSEKEQVIADEAEESAMEEAERLGLPMYEVSNFAKPGCSSSHNRVYWKMNSSLGIGPSAVSTLHNYDNEADLNKRRAFRLTCGSSGQYKSETISHDDFLFENLMMGLRMTEGLDVACFRKRFGIHPFETNPEACSQAVNKGWLQTGPDQFAMTQTGLQFLNSFLISLMD